MTQIARMLRLDEGFKPTPYKDTQGYPTVGIGQRIGPKNALMTNYTFSISKSVADVWMQEIAAEYLAKMAADARIKPALLKCNAARTDALVNMGYQMGVSGLAGFIDTLALIAKGDYENAAAGMLSSLWAKQTPQRAKRISETMRLGDYSAYEKAGW